MHLAIKLSHDYKCVGKLQKRHPCCYNHKDSKNLTIMYNMLFLIEIAKRNTLGTPFAQWDVDEVTVNT